MLRVLRQSHRRACGRRSDERSAVPPNPPGGRGDARRRTEHHHVADRGAHADEPEPTKVLLLLDVSGSMNEPIVTGGTKLAAAKRALTQVADALPPGTEVGLRVYGSKIAEPKSRNPKACTDTQLVMPPGPLEKSSMYRAVDSFAAKGETPIAYSMQKSVADLGAEGKRVLVLISDGEETCAKDPCPAARRLASAGVNLQFNAIGLAVNSKARCSASPKRAAVRTTTRPGPETCRKRSGSSRNVHSVRLP